MPLPATLLTPPTFDLKSILNKYLHRNDYKDLEVEARLGTILNIITRKRIDMHTDHPVIFSRLSGDMVFENGVLEKDFDEIKSILCDGTILTPVKDRVTITDNIRRIQSETETIYQKKVRICSVDIYLPDYKYDVRVSVSKETIEKKPDGNRPVSFTRIRERESLKDGPFMFDFTKVSKDSKPQKTFEVEVELKNEKDGLNDFMSLIFNLPVIKR